MEIQTNDTGSPKRTHHNIEIPAGMKIPRSIFPSPQTILVPQTVSFLDLPAELRNIIYSYATKDDEHLKIDSIRPTKLTSISAVSRLNKQTREEYVFMLDVHSNKITAVVKDFNFKPVETFYKHNFPSPKGISMKQILEAQRQSGHSSLRRLMIHLEFSPDYLEHLASCPADYLAPYWMDQAKHPARKILKCGVVLSVGYFASQREREGWKYRDIWLGRWAKKKSRYGDDDAERIYDVTSMGY